MHKWIVALALGVGLIFAGGTAVEAKKRITRHSKGVKMKCSAYTKRCTFKNKRIKKMRCTYKVRYKVKKRGSRKFRKKIGVIKIRARGFKSVKFYRGPFKVKKFKGGKLKCRKW